MPELDGLEATRRVLALPHAPRVLVLTTFDMNEYVYEAMKSGASGFLLKDTRPEALIDAVRTVAHGDALLAPTITRRLIEEFTSQAPPDASAGTEVAALDGAELAGAEARRGGPLECRDRGASLGRRSRGRGLRWRGSSRSSTSATARRPSSSPTGAASRAPSRPSAP